MKLFAMDDLELKNEIEMRINPIDFSISSSELIDIMNMFDADKEKVVHVYSQIIEEMQSEIRDTTEDVIDYFRDKGNYYPSYKQFRELFDTYTDNQNVHDSILRDMYKQTITDKNQLSLFEIVKDELKKVMSESDDDFDIAASKIMKNWGGEIKKDRSAKLSPQDIFDVIDAGDVARRDIESEFGEDEFMAMTDDEYKGLMDDIYEAVDEKGLFQAEDAEGNIIKKLALVTPVGGVDKKGRVTGFGDDGQGRMQILVTWEWPIDMKYTNPEEMGKDRVYPEDIVLASSKNMNENEYLKEDEIDDELELDKLHFDKSSLYKWILDALHQLDVYSTEDVAMAMEKAFERDYDYKLKMNEMKNEEQINEVDSFLNELEDCTEEQEQALEEMRGLGKGVKNSGNRNVKLRDDNHHAPLTNLDEAVEKNINKLFEGKVTKKQLVNFISEQAKEVANKLRN